MNMKKTKIVLDSQFGEEYKGTYVFGAITWAKRNRIIQKHTKYHPMTGNVVNSDYVAIQAETIFASLKTQPKNEPISLEKLLGEDEGIPIELGERFVQVVNKLSSIGQQDIRFLLEQLNEKDRTLLFQSFGFVKSSVGHPTS